MDLNRLSPDPIHQVFGPPKETFMAQKPSCRDFLKSGLAATQGRRKRVPSITVGGMRSFSTPLLLVKTSCAFRGSSNLCSGM